MRHFMIQYPFYIVLKPDIIYDRKAQIIFFYKLDIASIFSAVYYDCLRVVGFDKKPAGFIIYPGD